MRWSETLQTIDGGAMHVPIGACYSTRVPARVTVESTIESTWDGRPIGPDEAVRVALTLGPRHWAIEIDAPYHGDPAPPGPVGSHDRLWEHEVAEVFVASDGEHYTEVELSPHGHHLVLLLEGVRHVVSVAAPLGYVARIEGDRWRGRARLATSLLPPRPHRWNAFALHGAGEERRHLALAPTLGEVPDFHRLESFRPLA